MNAVRAPGPGDVYDHEYDKRVSRSEAIERIEVELYADDAELSEAICDFLCFMPKHPNAPFVREALKALRESDYAYFGDLCDRAAQKYIADKAQDHYEDREEYR